MRSKIALLAVLAVLVAGDVGGGAVDDPREVAHAWVAAYNDRDADRLCGLFVPPDPCSRGLRASFADPAPAVRVAGVHRDAENEAWFVVVRAADGRELASFRMVRADGRWLVDPATSGPTAAAR